MNGLAITFSPDGRFLAYALTDDRNNVILSSPDGTQTIRTLSGMRGTVWELIFSPDRSLLVSDGRLLYIGKPSCD
jgi:WD40 repeat protein